MKKLLVFLVFCLMNLVSFSAMKDGIYYVEKEYDNEWTSFVKITVKNDKIIGAQYDRKNSEGVLLSFDQKENDKSITISVLYPCQNSVSLTEEK